jgi:hypothetical protein
MRKLKRSHKNLMVLEAGYIYCKRHNLNYDTFIDEVFMTEEFHSEEESEFNRICSDLRCYKYFDSYRLIEITDDEYEMCLDEFGITILRYI